MKNSCITNRLLKRTALAVALTSVLFGSTAYAAIQPFESEKTKQITGFQPIIPSIGAAIVKGGIGEPYVAPTPEEKARVEVGDILYVPVGITEQIREQFKEALREKGIFDFSDLDGDEKYEGGAYEILSGLTPKDTKKAMNLLVEWYVMPQSATSLSEEFKVAVSDETEKYGVPYTVKKTDAGKKIGFKITPVTVRGLPYIGTPLEVLDVSKLAGQKYPENPNKPGEKDPSLPTVITPESELPDGGENPNIGGGGIVKSPYSKYRVVIVNSADKVISGSEANTEIPYVNSTYTAKIQKIAQNEKGEIVEENSLPTYVDLSATELEALENNIVWQLYEGETLLVNTGLSNNAQGNATELEAIRTDTNFAVVGNDATGRLSNGTLKFTTQLNNQTALAASAEGSEQGLMLKAILIADDELDEVVTAPAAQ